MMYQMWQRCHHFLHKGGGTAAVLTKSLSQVISDECRYKISPRCRFLMSSAVSSTKVPLSLALDSKCLTNYHRIISLPKSGSFFTTSCVVRHRTPSENETESKALVLWSDLKKLRTSPRPVLAASAVGLLPFLCPSVYFVFTQQTVDLLMDIQTIYGAVTLSFLVGIQWGSALIEITNSEFRKSSQGPYWHSIIPVMLAWIGLLLPLNTSFLALISGHGYSMYQDISTLAYPSWFRALRFVVGLVAIVSLWTTFICSLSQNSKIGSKVKK